MVAGDWNACPFRPGRRRGVGALRQGLGVAAARRRSVFYSHDRSADRWVAWLQALPGVKVVSSNRRGGSAEGARRGEPDAVQVADRWHLLANLRETLGRLLHRQHAALPSVPRTSKAHKPAASKTTAGPSLVTPQSNGASAFPGEPGIMADVES